MTRKKIGELLEEIHERKSGGHLGVDKILDKIRQRFYRDDVESWCRKCQKCGATKGPKTRSRGEMQKYNVGAPFERIAIDVAGSFPVTDDGNKYILVATDYFSKWVEAHAIPDQEASTVVRSLVDNMFPRFKVSMELHSDQEKNF